MRSKQATIVADLGFGDAGKGTMVDYLARKGRVSAVVRFNGGGQAAHNVVSPDGRHHTFRQFGSGTFVPGIQTHLSRFMLVDPVLLCEEANRLEALGCGKPLERLTVDEAALVVTPLHRAANRFRERLRGAALHGSCGMGIGETMADSLALAEPIRVRHLGDTRKLAQLLRGVQERKREEFKQHFALFAQDAYLADDLNCLNDPRYPESFAEETAEFAKRLRIVGSEHLNGLASRGNLLFEGAQGVLIDEWYGFHPYTTWSTTTFENAQTLLREIGYDHPVERLGVLRAYFTRHGAGPFVTEDADLTARLPDEQNGTDQWQGAFRVGWFDLVAARYALAVAGSADSLAITNLDRFENITDRKVCDAYRLPDGSTLRLFERNPERTDLATQEKLTRLLTSVRPEYRPAPADSSEYLAMLERELGVPITYTSHGPVATDKRERSLK